MILNDYIKRKSCTVLSFPHTISLFNSYYSLRLFLVCRRQEMGDIQHHCEETKNLLTVLCRARQISLTGQHKDK